MGQFVLVGVGGFLGSALRYYLSGLIQSLTKSYSFPYGTLGVNIAGCLLIGALSELAEARGLLSPEARLVLIVGLLGGFTTFSTFANESLNLIRLGQVLPAILNVLTSVSLGLMAAWAGRLLAHALWR
ncbi:MAG: fluoride efflux transporter CrcB [Anaerolineales bacterium]